MPKYNATQILVLKNYKEESDPERRNRQNPQISNVRKRMNQRELERENKAINKEFSL